MIARNRLGEGQMELRSQSRRFNGGFTLLEALIALVVFSVALLGLAGMYTQMMSMSHSAYLRTLATIQASDLEERIRANPDQADDYAIDDCSAEAGGGSMAATDRAQWCANTSTLFGADRVVATVTDLGGDYLLALEWSERGLTAEGDQALETVRFEYRVSK